jgi:LmbE family N-acetylglucosaminyl deacetylase
MTRRSRFLPSLALLAASCVAATAQAQITPLALDEGATGLGLALRQLPVSASVLYITAHPDDENNGVLVMLNRGRGVKTALLTLTRGDGGQNAIGPELFEALGILRTEELAAIHRYDGAQQFFTRAFEFGFSFSVEETFAKWGREEILADVVRVIRRVRPDVILTMPLEGRGGGQHHQASAQLAREAFRVAADPSRFPEQIREGLRPWQARKLYQGGTGGGPLEGTAPEASTVVVKTSDYDPLLGMSWFQLGMLSRAMHKCQGAGQLGASPGDGRAPYLLVDSEPRTAATETDLLQDVDSSMPGLARFARGQDAPFLTEGLAAIDAAARDALAAYDARGPERALPAVARGLTAARTLRNTLRDSPLDAVAKYEIERRLASKEQDFERALGLAQGVLLRVTADDGDVARGQTFRVTARAFNQGRQPLSVEAIELRVPAGWTLARSAGEAATLGPGERAEWRYAVTVGPAARYSQPYWKRNPKVDRYDIESPEHHTLPWSPPDVVAALRYAAGGVTAALELPAYFRYEGPWVGGEKQKVVNVVPLLSVASTPGIAVIPTSSAVQRREFRVNVSNNVNGASTVSVRLEAPAGWTVEPKDQKLELRSEGEERSVRFFVTPPAGLKAGDHELRAVAVRGNEEFRAGYQTIAYDHIQERHLIRPAVSRVAALDAALAPGILVGYVSGAGDDVPEAIEQLGARLALLNADDLAYGDLSKYTTIVTGVRAYRSRKDLRAYNGRLLEYAERGGNLVIQYNRTFEFNQLAGQPTAEGSIFSRPREADSAFAPYPAMVTDDRVTVEEAPLRVLVPGARLLTTPNRIGDADFAGWVQERGLNFLRAKDERYQDLLAASDPWPNNPGEKRGLLTVANVGKGTWTYVGLGLWRQLSAGTPGAYRLLANLLSQPRGE